MSRKRSFRRDGFLRERWRMDTRASRHDWWPGATRTLTLMTALGANLRDRLRSSRLQVISLCAIKKWKLWGLGIENLFP